MNAAAKLLNQRALSLHWVVASFFTRAQLVLSICLFMIFMTAFSIIYITNSTRDLHSGLYLGKSEYGKLYAQQEQLLLEKSTLAMQARVERIAETALNMVIPDHQLVVMVRE